MGSGVGCSLTPCGSLLQCHRRGRRSGRSQVPDWIAQSGLSSSNPASQGCCLRPEGELWCVRHGERGSETVRVNQRKGRLDAVGLQVELWTESTAPLLTTSIPRPGARTREVPEGATPGKAQPSSTHPHIGSSKRKKRKKKERNPRQH